MAWNWSSLADTALNALLKPNMKALEDELKRSAKYFPSSAVTRTTDATVTTLVAVSVPVNETLLVSGYVAARRTGGSSGSANDGAGYRVEFAAKNTSGTAALIGAGVVTVLGESQAGWDCALSASGGDIRVRVTGAADNNITWAWTTRSFTVTG